MPTLKRKHFYFLERAYTDAAVWTLPALAKTRITPNHITVFNLFNGALVLALIGYRHYLAAAALIQLYLFLDILDGNLARYSNLTSQLGKRLDNLGDRVFYNALMIMIGWMTPTHWVWIPINLLVYNAYAATATWHIVPRIRRMDSYRRFPLKQKLMDRGWILGMDLSTQDLLITLLIATPWNAWILPIVSILYVIDGIYRLLELHVHNRPREAK